MEQLSAEWPVGCGEALPFRLAPFVRRPEAPGNAGKPKILNWAPVCPGWREHTPWCLRFPCPRKFWQVLQGSLSLPASSVGLVLLLVVRSFHSVLGCLTGVTAACIHVHLILLTEGVSSASSYAVAILDLSLYSQLFKSVFSMNSFYSDVEELREK